MFSSELHLEICHRSPCGNDLGLHEKVSAVVVGWMNPFFRLQNDCVVWMTVADLLFFAGFFRDQVLFCDKLDTVTEKTQMLVST